ncbi:WD40 repeat domain-containing protein [Ktedonospora formicarum]|uniref:Anaphase-promoting complex subunit 4 WD40 domain-containing protein n=1 Tax=Ktedonospora formicarum TaxID=2778364 RepID=A0A8J3ICX0_9CHLR|nr:WD40 repeat domain-containing protein [Ktedonospora formicarum]GHO49953.1 hypothetical protein KSX_81160 [Ktedonospora formicarum]
MRYQLASYYLLVLLGCFFVSAIVACTPSGNAPGSTEPKPVYVYHGQSKEVWSVSWSPDSKRIASASDDGTVQVWDATTGKHVFTVRETNKWSAASSRLVT